MSHTIDGTALSTYCIEADYQLGLADVAGQAVSVPRQLGLRTGSRTLKGRDYPLGLRVIGSTATGHRRPPYTRGQYLDYVQALAALILKPDANGDPQEFVLGRTLPTAAGTQTCTIRAIYLGSFRVSDTSAHSGLVRPVLTLLDPWWLDGATKVYA